MNKEIAQKWTTALRSGEWKQGKGNLEKDGLNCCLGVLCRLAAKEIPLRVEAVLEIGVTVFGIDWVAGTLPQEVKRWAGMASTSGILPDDHDLAELNDRGMSFAAIADVIDKEYEWL